MLQKIYRKKLHNRVNSYKLKFNQIGNRSDRCLQDRRIRCTDAYGSGREPKCLKILVALRYLIWNITFVSEMFDTSKCNGINSLCTNQTIVLFRWLLKSHSIQCTDELHQNVEQLRHHIFFFVYFCSYLLSQITIATGIQANIQRKGTVINPFSVIGTVTLAWFRVK